MYPVLADEWPAVSTGNKCLHRNIQDFRADSCLSFSNSFSCYSYYYKQVEKICFSHHHATDMAIKISTVISTLCVCMHEVFINVNSFSIHRMFICLVEVDFVFIYNSYLDDCFKAILNRALPYFAVSLIAGGVS